MERNSAQASGPWRRQQVPWRWRQWWQSDALFARSSINVPNPDWRWKRSGCEFTTYLSVCIVRLLVRMSAHHLSDLCCKHDTAFTHILSARSREKSLKKTAIRRHLWCVFIRLFVDLLEFVDSLDTADFLGAIELMDGSSVNNLGGCQ